MEETKDDNFSDESQTDIDSCKSILLSKHLPEKQQKNLVREHIPILNYMVHKLIHQISNESGLDLKNFNISILYIKDDTIDFQIDIYDVANYKLNREVVKALSGIQVVSAPLDIEERLKKKVLLRNEMLEQFYSAILDSNKEFKKSLIPVILSQGSDRIITCEVDNLNNYAELVRNMSIWHRRGSY